MDIFPDLVCTQEVVWQQSQYLQNKLRPFYAYFGRPRDSQRDEEVGIFVRKDRFLVIEEDTVWLSESRLEGSVGFDAKLPRSMHYLVLRPILDELHCAEQPIIVANTHLDHVGYVSRQ